MITLEITEDNLFINNELLKLSLLHSRDNFLFALTGLANGKIKSVREFSIPEPDDEAKYTELVRILRDFNYDSSLIIKKNISIISDEFSLVPNSLNQNIDVNTLMSPVSIKQYLSDFQIIKSEVSNINTTNYFPVASKLLDVLNSELGNPIIHHGIDYLIENALNFVEETDFILCNFTHNSIQSVIYKNREFVASHVFSNSSRDDILYNVLSIYYNNGLPINTFKLILSGRIDKESAIYNTFTDHIKHIAFVNFNSREYFSEKFRNTTPHLLFDIYLLSTCV